MHIKEGRSLTQLQEQTSHFSLRFWVRLLELVKVIGRKDVGKLFFDIIKKIGKIEPEHIINFENYYS